MTYKSKIGPAQKKNIKKMQIDSLYRSTDYETSSSAASQAQRRASTTTTFVNTPTGAELMINGNPFNQKQVHDMYLKLLSIQ